MASMKHRIFGGLGGLLAIASLGVAGSALATNFPTKPIRFLVGVAPGGGTDFMARLVAQKLSEEWGNRSWSTIGWAPRA